MVLSIVFIFEMGEVAVSCGAMMADKCVNHGGYVSQESVNLRNNVSGAETNCSSTHQDG